MVRVGSVPPCRSEPARDSGVPVTLKRAERPLSRAGSLLQGLSARRPERETFSFTLSFGISVPHPSYIDAVSPRRQKPRTTFHGPHRWEARSRGLPIDTRPLIMSKKSRSKLWFLVHSWLALPIWFFVLIVCVTGTLAVVSQEIVWLANPDIRASKPSDDAQPLSFDQVIAAIKHDEPKAIVQSIIRPDESHFALSVGLSYPDGRSVEVYANPYTGALQGISPSFNFQQFTRALHGWWLVPFTNGYSWGWYLVSALGLPLLASLITGLVVYKRFWKGFLRPTLRIRHGARIFWGDFHRLSGIWSIWFIAVISITGTWFLIEAVLGDNQISISSEPIVPVIARDKVPLSAPRVPAPMIPIDKAIDIAAERIPGLDASFVFMPSNAYSHLQIGGRGWYPLMFQTAQLNPPDGG